MRPKNKYMILTIISMLLIFMHLTTLSTKASTAINPNDLELKPYTDFTADIETESINQIFYSANTMDIYVETTDNTYYKTINPEYDTFKKEMLEKGLIVKTIAEFQSTNNSNVSGKDVILFIVEFMCLISFSVRWWFSSTIEKRRLQMAAGPTILTKEAPKNKQPKETPKTFDDIAGLDEVKKDMQCLVDFLKNKDKYVDAGATLPKGVIFYGPPGTGKTLLAKAIAGEAGVPFHYMSGSDFVEMYVGVGAKRVRELFEKARRQTPCIIFIDEIDAIGGKRSMGDANGEDRKTINALLTEMDGFDTHENIIVIAATNRLEDLDPALVRPGRFTNKFCVPLPESPRERLAIIKIYAKNKKFAEDVSFKALAKETTGFSPAAIEALLNEATIISVQDKKMFVDRESIDKAMFKVLLSGHVKENQADRNKEELKIVAWHEAGHALIGKLNGKSVPKVTILSTTSGAGGVTFTAPKDMGLYSMNDLKAEVAELYGGLAAEYVLFKDKNRITTGASNDIQRATNIIKGIVTSYGMSEEFGLLNLEQLQVDQSKILEQEVKLAKEIESYAINLLSQNYNILQSIANALLEKETLYEHDLNSLMSGVKIPDDMETITEAQNTKTANTSHNNTRRTGRKKKPMEVFKELITKKVGTRF